MPRKKATERRPRAPSDAPGKSSRIKRYFGTGNGTIYLGDSRLLFEKHIGPQSVDLIVTSPPFGLIRKKDYGNVDADEYLEWFRPFGACFREALKPTGSLVIDIGGAWIPGQPTRSLYHYELLIMLCREFDLHLAQDFFWWNPAKLPTPAEWVTVRRVRVKDAVNCVWWLSPTPWPKASNRRVLTPYSDSMKGLLRNGYKAKKRPSGHDISTKFSQDNGASISSQPPAFPNTDSNSHYLRFCKDRGLPQHPARFPAELPEYFIRMLTDPGDLVVDPFAGSCVVGEVAERLGRAWVCSELVEAYVEGALSRFQSEEEPLGRTENGKSKTAKAAYSVSNSAALWNGDHHEPLPADGGRTRKSTARKKK